MSNLWLLLGVWMFVGHIYWIKSGVVHFNYLYNPPKSFFVWLELCYMLLFWLMGPLTPMFPYYTFHPGVSDWKLHYRYPED